jgi:hypothetical protein
VGDEVTIVSLDNPGRWEAQVGAAGMPSQSWGYARALRDSGIESRLAIVGAGGSRMVCAFHEREWLGTTDIATIPGLSGASIDPASTAPLNAWRDHATEQGWVAGYIQLAPGIDLGAVGGSDEVIAQNDVFMLDLSVDDPLAGASQIVHRKVRRAERLGASLVEERRALSGAIVDLFPATMRRVGATQVYDFAPATLVRWTGDARCLALGARMGGAIEAISLFTVRGPMAEYHLNASTEAGRDLASWLIVRAITRLRDRGVTCLNLGGGIRRGDGVAQFKQRFHPIRRPLFAVRQVYDHGKYEQLCARAGVGGRGEWFPAYRAGRKGQTRVR